MHGFTTKLLYFFPYENKIGVLTRGGLERQDCLGWFSVIRVIEAWKLNVERQALKLWSKKIDLRKRWQLNPTWIHIISFRNLIQTTSLLDSRLTKVHWKALKITWVVALFCPSHFFFFLMCFHSYLFLWGKAKLSSSRRWCSNEPAEYTILESCIPTLLIFKFLLFMNI